MSLPGKRRQPSIGKKMKRSKSNESKKKMSFTTQQSSQLSINTILQNTIKLSNQTILASQPNYRQSVLNLSRESFNSQKNTNHASNQSQQNNMQQIKDVYYWEIFKIEEKRKIKGIKAKLLWCNGKENNWVMVRAVLTDNYIRMNEPEYFMELDSSNLDISFQEQKLIQSSINFHVEEEQNRADQLRNQIFFWLKATLISIHSQFMSMKLNLRKKTKVTDYKRSKINKNYILYPSPASLTWSPHGMLCLTENKVGIVSIPIVGNMHSYRNIIEAPYKFQRFSRKNNEIDDLKMVEERREDQQETTEAEFFGWNVKQQISFSIFGKLIEEQIIQPKQSKFASENHHEKAQKKASKDYQMYYLGNTNSMTPKLQKIYRRHFCGSYENAEFQFLQKLKIFVVKSQSSQLEDGISYLIDKIQRHDRTGAIQALLQNQFTGYNGAFNKYQKGQQKYERLKYELIGQFLQQKIKQCPQSQHFLYMKSVMVENQFFRLALQNYFQESFKKLKIVDKKYQQLGTFDNFDELKAEKILFYLLQQLLKAQKSLKQQSQKIKYHYKNKPEKFDDPDYKQKKYAKMMDLNIQMKLLLKGYVKKIPKNGESNQSSGVRLLKSQSGIHFQNFSHKSQRNVNLNLMPFLVINKIELSPLQFSLILNSNQRKNFLQTVIPILWIKDRSSQNFEYKLAKRVVITNSKIINFLDKLNSIINLWKKLDSGRRSNFLRTIIKQYNRFEKRSGHRIGKIYTAYCQRCTGDFVAYNIEQLQRVTTCSRCKYLEGDQFIK